MTCCFYPLDEEQFEYLYSTVNKKERPPNQPNQELTLTESSNTTATGTNMLHNPHTQIIDIMHFPRMINIE